MKKRIKTIPAETMAALCRYFWPGNIRELANVIERSVVLSPGEVLRVSAGELKAPPGDADHADLAHAVELVERDRILHALHESNWIIGGSSGAAPRLGMSRQALYYKMKKLAICRQE
jgi:formate hydrogenlyase transcriptional activator